MIDSHYRRNVTPARALRNTARKYNNGDTVKYYTVTGSLRGNKGVVRWYEAIITDFDAKKGEYKVLRDGFTFRISHCNIRPM